MADVEEKSGREEVWKTVKLVRQQDMGMAVEEAQKMQRAVRVARPDFVPMFWFCSMGAKDFQTTEDECWRSWESAWSASTAPV
mmetsp:Transcript_25530/g.65095  ORF Transcript_25530/g.65095 Transcript_25530/m.65095 type:complete len:83 (+) Transcript_25530:168-416(+)